MSFKKQDIKKMQSSKNCDLVLLTWLFLKYCFSQLNIMDVSIDYLENINKYSQPKAVGAYPR